MKRPGVTVGREEHRWGVLTQVGSPWESVLQVSPSTRGGGASGQS